MRADPARGPILCLVTDRRRVYSGPDFAGALRALVLQATRAADAGVDLIQIREHDLDGAPLADLTAAVLDAVRGGATRVVVNERADVAIACGADGVHLREDSLPSRAARALAPPPFLVGRSVHGVAEAMTAAPLVDYLIAGTTFATMSKPGRTDLLGEEGLHAIARSVAVPVLAIGGITVERAAAVARAGAAGIAAIGLFLDDGGMPLDSVAAAVRREFGRAREPR